MRTGVPSEPNDAACVTLSRVPACVATALARPAGRGAKRKVEYHDETLKARTLMRLATVSRLAQGWWVAPTFHGMETKLA